MMWNLVTIAADTHQTLPKFVQGIRVQLLKTADAAKKNPLDEVEETPCGGGIPPPHPLVPPRV